METFEDMFNKSLCQSVVTQLKKEDQRAQSKMHSLTTINSKEAAKERTCNSLIESEKKSDRRMIVADQLITPQSDPKPRLTEKNQKEFLQHSSKEKICQSSTATSCLDSTMSEAFNIINREEGKDEELRNLKRTRAKGGPL